MPCSLYLVSPAGLKSDEPGFDDFAAQLNGILEHHEIACFLLRRGTQDDTALEQAVKRLRAAVQDHGTAFVVEDAPELVVQTGCDGVHLTDPEALTAARDQLGTSAIVGVECSLSRHDGLEAADRGADYVAFRRGPVEAEAAVAESLEEVLAWWQEMVTVPCVAMDPANLEDCARLAAAGADFLAVGDLLWNGPDEPGDLLARIAKVLAQPG